MTLKYLTVDAANELAARNGLRLKFGAVDFPQPHSINGEPMYAAEALEAFLRVAKLRTVSSVLGLLLKTYDYCSDALQEMNRINLIDARLSLKIVQDQSLTAVKNALFAHWNTSSLHYAELGRLTEKLETRAQALKESSFVSITEWDAEQVAEHLGLLDALMEEIKNQTGLLKRYQGERHAWELQKKIAARGATEFHRLLAQGGRQHRQNVIEIEQAKADSFNEIRQERESVVAMVAQIRANLRSLMEAKTAEEHAATAAYRAFALECPPAPAIIITAPPIDTTPRPQVTALPWDDPDFEDDDGEDVEYFYDVDIDD